MLSILFYILIFIIAMVSCWLFVPFARNFAFLFNAMDKPSERKVHLQPTPRCGGIALVIAFYISFLLGILGLVFIFKSHINYSNIFGIILGSLVIFFIGIFDDIISVPAFVKLLFQLFASLIPVFFELSIKFVSIPFVGILLLGGFSIPLTILWITTIVNAMNFIDGLDGLASGVSAIASFTLFLVAIKMRQPAAALMMIALCGVSVGFLRYNFYPASIFLGDSGSLFLGYILATASIIGVLKSTVIFLLLIPLIVLGIPIFDTVIVVIRRIKARQHIFHADKRHLHHRLLDLGLSHKQVVLLIYTMSIGLSVITLLFTFLPLLQAIVLMVVLFLLLILFIPLMRHLFGGDNA